MDEKFLSDWIEWFKKVEVFVFDIEIDGFDIFSSNLIGFFFVVVLGEVVYLLLVYDYLDVFV